jgi:hypothetical protein
MASCWLIDDQERPPTVAMEVAQLRGMRIDRLAFSAESQPADVNAAASLITISFDRLAHLSSLAQSRLKRSVMQGTTLHVTGNLAADQPFSLAPFAEGSIATLAHHAANGYRFTDYPMLPAALRNEERTLELTMMAASNLPQSAQPLLILRCADAVERTSVFIVRAGSGAVIYDLTPATTTRSMPLPAMLENPATLPGGVGVLVAASIAWKAQPLESRFNIVIDDRPADLDYFNCGRVLAFFRHLEHVCPGVHVDFAWTPDQSHPSRRYIAVLKSFRTGFVWHGLLRHIDHRAITDLATEYAAGLRLVEQVRADYAVRFQPVMIFPFERDTPRCVDFLEQQGFLAMARTAAEDRMAAESGTLTGNLSRSLSRAGRKQFAVLERFPSERLTRERMVARAALGLPIIASCHPYDVGLVRFAALRPRARGSFAHFDSVLRFAAEKQLRAASLEEIAQGMIEN